MSPAVDIGGPGVRAPENTGYETSPPDVAAFDGGFAATWVDTRAGLNAPSVVVARLDDLGGPSAPFATVVRTAPDIAQRSRVACRGSACMVAWSQGSGIAVAPYDAASNSIGTTQQIAAGNDPTIANDGTAFVLGWYQGTDFVVARLKADGSLAQAAQVVSTGSAQGRARIFPALDGLIAVWSENNLTGFRMMSRYISSGGALDPARAIGTGASSTPVIASNLTYAIVVWADGSSLYSVRFGPVGEILDAPPKLLRTIDSGYGDPSITIDAGGTCWLVYRDAANQLFGSTIDLTTGAQGAAAVIVSPPLYRGSALFSALASGPGGPVVVWNMGQFGAVTMYGARLVPGPAIKPVVPPLIDSTASGQLTSSLVWAGDHFIAAWGEQLASTRTVKTRLVGPTALPLTPVSTVVSTPAHVQTLVRQPTGQTALVYADATYTQAMWLTNLAADNVTLGPPQNLNPDMACGERVIQQATVGEVTVLEWSGYDGANRVQAARWFADGGISTTSTLVTAAGGYIGATFTASSVTHLLVWVDQISQHTIAISRVSPALTLLDAPPLQVIETSDLTSYTVASDGLGFLVVWSVRNGSADVIRGQLISAGPVPAPVGAPFTIADVGENQFSLQSRAQTLVVYDGHDYQVGWLADNVDGGTRLRWKSVSSTGVVSAANEWVNSPNFIDDFGLVTDGHGRLAASWAEYSPALGARRTWARVLTNLDDGQVCTGASDCRAAVCNATGHCGLFDAGTAVADAGTFEPSADAGVNETDGGVSRQPKAYLVGCSCDAADAPIVLLGWLVLTVLQRTRRRL